MRFSALAVTALSLMAGTAVADQSSSWSTATSTRTVFMVLTETRTGSPPAPTLNSTSSSSWASSGYGAHIPTGGSNGTVPVTVTPSSTVATAQPTFTGAAAGRAVGSAFALVAGAAIALAL
ncbi:MAG: hypothetical protein INR71_05845 [Terriglobus roseus]|nr:hypothetical protein [Terriglobus roseus]